MPLLYQCRWELKGKHADSITALSFSKSGQYLASASMDSRLCVWSPNQGAKFTIEGTAGFISLAWVDENTLLSGTEDGRLITVEFSNVLLRVTGFEMHAYPLECLDVRGNRLATGSHSYVSVWDLVPGVRLD
ncbi:hypothetical protein BDN72DRAFT_905475 [Pluteus cervinus]|uniref:Uncharacterized protein n=1 Tax=Pluteus cervinus TaxID=181527 RepID=A0ACD3A2U2_9AGAR|nr:hypothetical protein BDN72DRAFT_905475 [Pluteus cervinus]